MKDAKCVAPLHVVAMIIAAALIGCSSAAVTPSTLERTELDRALDMRNGEHLYQAHCHTCHTSQAHWRDNSIVSQWSDILEQVDRWQRNAGQHWRPSDVDDVAAYLNIAYYKLPCPTPGCRNEATTRWTPTEPPWHG